MKRLMPQVLAVSTITWVPITLFSVNAKLLPKLHRGVAGRGIDRVVVDVVVVVMEAWRCWWRWWVPAVAE